jgi:hypothetical protein
MIAQDCQPETIYDSFLPCHADAALRYLISHNTAAKWNPFGNEVPVLYKNIMMWRPADSDIPPPDFDRI